MKHLYSTSLHIALLIALLLLAACDSSARPPQVQGTVTINPNFQGAITPIPTVPPYRCGAWTSVNNPGPSSTITIYARLTKDTKGVSGATATATVHFANGDLTFYSHPASDEGGYVTFTLDLQGRQPSKTPATIDVTFKLKDATVACTPAFFTPQ